MYLLKVYLLGVAYFVRFSSKSVQTIVVVLILTTVYFFAFCLVYLFAPFYYEPSWQREDDNQFVPYREQPRAQYRFHAFNKSYYFDGLYHRWNAQWYSNIGP